MTKIDIISGFLGAGKTTLIKKLIKDVLHKGYKRHPRSQSKYLMMALSFLLSYYLKQHLIELASRPFLYSKTPAFAYAEAGCFHDFLM